MLGEDSPLPAGAMAEEEAHVADGSVPIPPALLATGLSLCASCLVLGLTLTRACAANVVLSAAGQPPLPSPGSPLPFPPLPSPPLP